jgi:signal peptidase II
MTPERRKYIIFAVLALLTIGIDQWTKVLARADLKPLGFAGKQVFGGRFVLRYSENTGVAFGLFQSLTGGRIILTIFALLALGLVISYLRKTENTQVRLQAALGLIGGGALGNVIDRVTLGAVTDFLVVDLGVWPLNPWPAFNIADAGLVIGMALMAIDMLRPPKTVERSDPGADAGPQGAA